MIALWLIAGLLLLTVGAEVLVRGAVRLALGVGLSPLVIGLTVVAYGTSAPEVAVSVKASWLGQTEIALGNVVGSNTFNVLFILGLSALIAPLIASRQLVRVDVPVMIAVSGLTWWMARDGHVGRAEGLVLCGGLVVYTLSLLWLGQKVEPGQPASATAVRPQSRDWARPALLVLVGLGLLVLGARWFVRGAEDLARLLGVGEWLIGLTIVAAGTSLPEVATSILASLRGQRDIAVGNVVGSNIFNLLGVLGVSASVAPAGMPVSPAALSFDLPVLCAVALVCLPIFFTGGRIARLEGALLLGFYAVYLTVLILAATRHWALAGFQTAVLWIALPLAGIGIGVSLWTSLRRAPLR